MKEILNAVTGFFRNIYAKITEMFSGRNRRRQASARRAEPERTSSRRPRRLTFWQKAERFVVNLWRSFLTWLRTADRRLVYALAGALVIVIALPIVLISVLGGSAEGEITPPEESQTDVEEAVAEEVPVVSEEPVIMVVNQEEYNEEMGIIDPYDVDAATVSLKYGDDDPLVASVQERLMELHYMDEDIPTEHFGSQTKNAVIYFQRKNGLEMDGGVGPITYELLFSDAAKAYSVSEGAEGDDVKQLQSRLYELGYIESVTSYYGTDTQAAVKRFQQLNGLTADGSVGAQTLEILYSEDVQANYLQYGANNDTVRKCQERLKKLGYLTTAADGNYGSDTVNAVKRFQERNGLIADGFLGASTKELLMSSKALSNALVLGVRGTDVENVQKRLKQLGYMKSVTGYFGEGTESAVMAFQKRNGLSADGKIGSQTMNKLFSDSAKKAASGSSSGGNKNNGSSSGNKNNNSSKPSTDKVADQKSVSALISVAKSKLGCKYVKGAKGPNTFDCSGFVYWCLNQIGVKQGYMTSAGWASNGKYPKVTKLSDVQAGDIIAFKGHVGIALGGGKMIDASSGDGCIRITNLSLAYWKKNFKCAFRVL